MATVSQPGSRAGLITTLVIFVVLFFIAAVFAVVKGLDNSDKEKKLTDLRNRYKDVVTDLELNSDELRAVKDLKTQDQSFQGRSVFDILLAQRGDLVKAITGQASDPQAALAGKDQLIQAANKRLQPSGISVPGGSLAGAVNSLADSVVRLNEQLTQLRAQFDKANQDMVAAVATYQAELQTHQKAVETAKAEEAKAKQEADAYRQNKDSQVSQVEKDHTDTIDKNKKLVDELTAQLTAKDQELAKFKKDNNTLITTLRRYRPADPAEAIVRKPDGKIIQVARNGVVYINLGLGQQISPGMTFQMYDKNEGVPKAALATNEEDLPAGKGALEVTRVGAGSSECRIIKMEPGATVFEGDLVANLVYDPDVKLKFRVYGQFDIDQNGVATAVEADIIKRLIAQWGGQLTEDIGVETDFVILGKEPVVPEYTKDQLDTDPVAADNAARAKRELDAYENVRSSALDFHVPLLNQNRFLYMIGFYEQAKK